MLGNVLWSVLGAFVFSLMLYLKTDSVLLALFSYAVTGSIIVLALSLRKALS